MSGGQKTTANRIEAVFEGLKAQGRRALPGAADEPGRPDHLDALLQPFVAIHDRDRGADEQQAGQAERE